MKLNFNLVRKSCQYIYREENLGEKKNITHQLNKGNAITKAGDIQEKAVFNMIC